MKFLLKLLRARLAAWVASLKEPEFELPAEGPAPRGGRLVRTAAFMLAAWVCFTFAFTPLRTSHDEWWHLKTGRYITEHGLPQNDIFTYTAENIPWHNHEWLAQIMLWRIFSAAGSDIGDEYAGILALVTFKSVVIVLAFAGFGLLLARRMREPLWAALAVAIAAALARRSFYFRPPFISYLLLAFLLWLFIEWRSGRIRPRWLWLAPPLFALWANLHGGWMAGLLVIGAFWADQALRALHERRDNGVDRTQTRRLIFLTILGAACVLGTCCNPNGYHLYKLAGNVMQDAYLLSTIGEMGPPNLDFVWILEGSVILMLGIALRPIRVRGLVLWLLLANLVHWSFDSPNPWVHTVVALPIYALAILRTARPGMLAHVLLVCFFAYQGIHHVRHLSLLAVILLPSLAWGLEAAVQAAATARGRGPEFAEKLRLAGLATLAGLMIFWTFGGIEGRTYFQRNLALLRGMRWEPTLVSNFSSQPSFNPRLPEGVFWMEGYPEQAVNFVLRAKLPGRIWNGGNYAGYLMWRLAPEHYKLFTDNRYDIYGGQFIREEHAVRNGWTREKLDAANLRSEDGFHAWNEVLDRWEVQTLFVESGEVINALLPDDAWKLVFEDYAYKIWVRNTPANQTAIDRALALPLGRPFEAIYDARSPALPVSAMPRQP